MKNEIFFLNKGISFTLFYADFSFYVGFCSLAEPNIKRKHTQNGATL